MKNKKRINLNKNAFTLIETLILVAILAALAIGATIKLLKNNEQERAKSAGERIRQLGGALDFYITNNKNKLLNSITKDSTVIADICILQTDTGIGCVNPSGLPVQSILSEGFKNDSLLNTGYKLALKNVDNNNVIGIVYTDSPVLLNNKTPKYDLLGIAVKAAGNGAGMSTSDGNDIIGEEGVWNLKRSIDSTNNTLLWSTVETPGILAYKTGVVGKEDKVYARIDGSNEMVADLLLGNNKIVNARSLSFDNYLTGQNAFFDNIKTQSIYSAGTIYTNVVNASEAYLDVVNTNNINPVNGDDIAIGIDDITNKNNAKGNIYTKDINSNKNIITGNNYNVNNIIRAKEYLILNSTAEAGQVCGTTTDNEGNNIPVSSGAFTKNSIGRIVSCQGGIWVAALDGAKGATGDTGDTGATGARGATGPRGPQGPAGYAGSSGGCPICGCPGVSCGGGGWYTCCFPSGSLVLMANGKLKLIEEVIVGDLLMGHLGKATKVAKRHYPTLGDRRMLSFKDGSHLWTEEHGTWVKNKHTGKEWVWSANSSIWLTEMSEEIGEEFSETTKYQGGLKDIYSISNAPSEDIEFCRLDGYISQEIVEIKNLSPHTKLHDVVTEDGQMIIVNGYAVGSGWNEYKNNYEEVSWNKCYKDIQKSLEQLNNGKVIIADYIEEIKEALEKVKNEFDYKNNVYKLVA